MQAFLMLLGAICILDTLFMSIYAPPDAGIKTMGVLGVPLFLMGIFYHTLYPVLHFVLVKWFLIILYSIPILVILVKATLIILRKLKPSTNTDKADAVIVLGLITRNNQISTELKRRVDRAYTYLCNNPKSIAILSGGIDKGEQRSEADIMYEYILSLGIDSSRVIKEEQATTTDENFIYSMPIVKEKFGDTARVVFVTTSYHVDRAEKTARMHGYQISGIASPGVWFKMITDFLREFLVTVKLKNDGML